MKQLIVIAALSAALAACTSSTPPTTVNGGGSPLGADSDTNFTFMFVGGASGIYRSSDKGGSWTPATVHVTNLSSIELSSIVSQGNNLYASSYYGVLRSSDGGLTWTMTDPRDTISTSLALLVDGGTIIDATKDPKIYRSSDSGTTWVRSDKASGLDGTEFMSLCQLGKTIFVSGSGPIGGTVWQSTDVGATWTEIDESTNTGFGPNLHLATNGTALYAASGNGVFRSDDLGKTWKSMGLGGQSLYSIAVYGNNVYVGSLGNSFLRSTDGGVTWNGSSDKPANKGITKLIAKGPNLFECSETTGIWMSRDSGQSWQSMQGNLPDSTFTGLGFK